MKIFSFSLSLPIALTCALLMTACTPKYDWREIRSADAPFIVALPAKPVSFSRPINLDGIPVTMPMIAAEVGGTTFAVGTAKLPDTANAALALITMKTALVKNIGGTVKTEKSVAAAKSPNGGQNVITIEIEAVGTRNGKPQPILLMARFIAQGKQIYQLVVLGEEKSISRDAADTFFTSFKLN